MDESRDFELVREFYGNDANQCLDVYLPLRRCRGTVCLFHGGFWKMPHGKDQLDDVSIALARKGFSVINAEYRRLGYGNTHYREILEDAAAAVRSLTRLEQKYGRINLRPLYVAGHSAGGHLALWLSSLEWGDGRADSRLAPSAFIGLAPVVDLQKCLDDEARGAYVSDFIGPTEEPSDAIPRVSPIALLPAANRQAIFHGVRDEYLPIAEIDAYEAAADRAGSPLSVLRIEGCAHMDFCDASSRAVAAVIDWIDADARCFSAR